MKHYIRYIAGIESCYGALLRQKQFLSYFTSTDMILIKYRCLRDSVSSFVFFIAESGSVCLV